MFDGVGTTQKWLPNQEKKEQQRVEPNEIRTRCERDGERDLNHRCYGPVITEDMAAMGHTMEKVASRCLCEKKSRSFRSAIPKLNATILNNPSKGQLSQKIWQLWDIQWNK